MTHRRGERHPNARLSDFDVFMILELHKLGLGYKRIAGKFEGYCSLSTVRNICKGYTRRPLSPEEVAGVQMTEKSVVPSQSQHKEVTR